MNNFPFDLNEAQFDPFGKVRIESGTANTNYRYNQEYYDGESDLIYMRARYYDPNLSRFISRDPVSGYLTKLIKTPQ